MLVGYTQKAGALAECTRLAAAALAVPCNLAVSRESAGAAAVSMGLPAPAAVVGMGLPEATAAAARMDLPAAAAGTAKATGRSLAEAAAPSATAMHSKGSPGHIDSCSLGCKQSVWERRSSAGFAA